jgi:hypothetical protein
MIEPGQTIENLRELLFQRAESKFGKARAAELQPELERTADELLKVLHHPVEFQDEP